MTKPTVTVTIVTARTADQIDYGMMHKHREQLLLGPTTPGELRALAAGVFQDDDVLHHTDYQLRALAMGADYPDEVLVIDRHAELLYDVDVSCFPFPVRYYPPQVASFELIGRAVPPFTRAKDTYLEASDKNTAALLCRSDILVMLDDACLPGVGLVHAAREVCAEGSVLVLGHCKTWFEEDRLQHSEANWMRTTAPEEGERTPFGIFAMPLGVFLEVDGLRESYNGRRCPTDIDLLKRVRLYAPDKLTCRRGAHVWEVPHDTLVAGAEMEPYDPAICTTWAAGNQPLLRTRRKIVQAYLDAQERAIEAAEALLEDDDGEDDEL
jgi:hypothetical protein